MLEIWQILRRAANHSVIVVIFLCGGMAKAGQELSLEIQPVGREQEILGLDQKGVLFQPEASVSRLDFLVSNLALLSENGTWVESQDWFAYFSAGSGRLAAQTSGGVPSGKYTTIRFDIGVPAAQDQADPAQWPAEHPLNPAVCGLHWGWQGGYVFMAVEGHWQWADGTKDGFSYHLARSPQLTRVQIPVNFEGGGPVTVRLALDVASLLQGIDFTRDGTSTHSREGDPLALALSKRLASAFRLISVHQDLYQSVQTDTAPSLPAAPGTHAYPLAVTQRFPQIKLPADNPLTQEGVSLGEKLFHDPRLSINHTQSCASCHDRGLAFSDARRVSVGAEGQSGKRQAMPLFNLAWASSYFWDGRAATLREQVLMPIQDAHEMNESLDRVVTKVRDLESDFAAAFGSAEVTPERMAKALEQYLLTQVSQESRFDRAARRVATLTEEEKRGLQLFVTEFDPARGLRGADCFHCHGGTLFTDSQFKNNGLDLTPADLGRMLVTGNPADKGKFKTPSLRNIAVTAPYMHDGRFKTLEEVVEHYSSGVKRSDTLDPNLAKHPEAGLQLTDEEKRALVAFLKTLTDDTFIAAPTASAVATRP